MFHPRSNPHSPARSITRLLHSRQTLSHHRPRDSNAADNSTQDEQPSPDAAPPHPLAFRGSAQPSSEAPPSQHPADPPPGASPQARPRDVQADHPPPASTQAPTTPPATHDHEPSKATRQTPSRKAPRSPKSQEQSSCRESTPSPPHTGPRFCPFTQLLASKLQGESPGVTSNLLNPQPHLTSRDREGAVRCQRRPRTPPLARPGLSSNRRQARRRPSRIVQTPNTSHPPITKEWGGGRWVRKKGGWGGRGGLPI